MFFGASGRGSPCGNVLSEPGTTRSRDCRGKIDGEIVVLSGAPSIRRPVSQR